MSELLKKYESIDQSKLSEATIKILNRVKTITADFTADDAKNNDIADKVMDEILKKNPDAVKIVKREPKAKPAPKKTHKAKGTHKAKATHKATPAPATKTSNNNIMSVAKEIQKTGESWKDAMERAKQVLKERKEENVQKGRTEMEKLLALVRTKKELQGFANSDIKRDSVRTSKVKGSRVVTREGFTSNQYKQNVPNKLGRKYWESRENRSDRLAPNYQKDMPLLARGGVLPDEYVRTVRWADGNYRVEKKTKQNDFGHTFNDVFEDRVKAEDFAKKISENNKIKYIGVNTAPYDFVRLQSLKRNKMADGGSFAPNVADGTAFMDNAYFAKGGKVLGKKGDITFTRGRGRGIVKDVYFKDSTIPAHYISYETDINEVADGLKRWCKIHNFDFDNIERVHFAKGGSLDIVKGAIKVGVFSTEDLKTGVFEKALTEKTEETGLTNVDLKVIKKGGKTLIELYLIPNEEAQKKFKIKKWYTKTYPTDDLGEELDEDATFEDVWTAVNNGTNVYSVFGVGDSLVRERIFDELSKIYGVDYEFIYKKWLKSDDYANGGNVDDSWELKNIDSDEEGSYGKVVHNGKEVADYEFDRYARTFWVENPKGGQMGIDTPEELFAFYKAKGFANGGGIDGGMNNLTIQEVSFANGGSVNMNKHIWEGWTVGDFIDDLEPQFNQIMSGGSWQKPFKTKDEVKAWCMDNQPYYKKNIPDVVNYFWTKVQSKGNYADGGSVGNDRMFNFLKDDLGKLEKANNEGNYEEVGRFFSYWLGSSGHLKSLKTEKNDRMYNFLKDDLEKLENSINNGEQEQVDMFFSYWGQHLGSLKMADGGIFASDNSAYLTDPNFGDFQNTSMFADGGSLITETVSAIFNPNQKRGKIETGFGSKTKEGLFAMMTNVNYSPEEITTAVFVPNAKKGRIYTEFGAKTKEGLYAMIENMRNTFEHGGSMASLTEQEFLKKYFGANVFTENPSQYFEIKKMSSDDDAKVNAFVKELKADGFTVKKRAYSDFTSVMGVKKKTSFELGGAFMMTDLAGHTGGSDGLGNPMPLSGVSGTHYTGLVGETGAMSSGELFAKGGSVNKNFDLAGWTRIESFENLLKAKEYVDDYKNGNRYFDAIIIKEQDTKDYFIVYARLKKGESIGNRVYARGGGVGDNVLGLKKGDIYKVIDTQHTAGSNIYTFIDYVDKDNNIMLKSLPFPPNPKKKNDFVYVYEVSSDGIKVLNDEEIGQVISRKYKNFVENNYEAGGAMMQNQQVIDGASQNYVITEAFGNPAQQLGMLAKGGAIKNQYEGRTPEDVWDNLTIKQKEHFLHDHFDIIQVVAENGGEKISHFGDLKGWAYRTYKALPFYIVNPFITHTKEGQYASGGSLGKALYVEYSSWFISNKYDEEKIMSVLQSVGAKNIRLENDRGWFNQPEVVVFNGDKNKAQEALNEAFDTEWIRVSEKDWRTKKMADGGDMGYFDNMSEEEILKSTVVFDNNGESYDRYTVYTPDGSVFGMSEDARGFNLYIGEKSEIPMGKHLGKKLSSVPQGIRMAVLNRMKEEYANGGSFAPNVADGTQFMNRVYAEGGAISYSDIKAGSKFRNDIGNVFVVDDVNNGVVKYHSEKFGKEKYENDLERFIEIMESQRSVKFDEGGTINGMLNKKIQKLAENKGLTMDALGRDEYNKVMTQALVESLTDANFHDEAKQVVVKAEGKTKWSDDLYQAESFNPDTEVASFAREVSRTCEWDGDDILNAYYFITKMQGSKVAGMIDDLFLNPKPTQSSSKPTKYIDHDDIESVTLNVNGNFVTFAGKDFLNGANLMEKGGDLSKIATYFPKRDIVKVTLKNGDTIKPLNGYWLKKGSEPMGKKTASTPPKTGKVTSPNYPNVNFNHKVVINGKTINLALAKSYKTGLDDSKQYDFIDVDGNPMTGYGYSVKEALKQIEQYGNDPIYYSKNTPPKIDETKAHFKMDIASGGKFEVFVDSNFVNQSQNNLPNTELKHYGFGDFYLQTPDGNIDFIRTSEEKQGFVGRTHKMKGSDELVLKLVDAMKEKGRFESTQTFANGGSFAPNVADGTQFMNGVYANGGGVSGRLEIGVYRVGKPTKVSANLYEQKIVEIFDNGDISTASDYGRKLSDFKSQKYPIITIEQLEAQYKMADGGSTGSGFDPVKVKVVLAVGLDRAIEFYDAEYPIRPIELLQRAVRGGYITLDEINEVVVDSAMETAQDSEDMDEVGSSDFGAYLRDFLDEAGFKIGYVNGRLTREYANGGSFAPNVSDGTAFMDNAYFADGGEVRRFNRHEQMDSETREEVLDVVSEPQLKGSLTNYLYGLYDGYDYSETENFKKEMSKLKSKDLAMYDRINAIYKKIDKYKFEQYDDFANGGGVSSYQVMIDGDWDEPKNFKTFSLAKKWIYENIKNHDSLELVDSYGDSIYVEGNSTKEDLDWLFSNREASFENGGSFAPNVADGTSFMDNAYFAKGGSLNVGEQRELRTFVNSLFNRAKNKISNDKGNSLFVVSSTINATQNSLGNPTFYLGVKKVQNSRPIYVVGSGFLSSDMLVYESYKKDSRFLETESIVEAKKFLTDKVKKQILHLRNRSVMANGGGVGARHLVGEFNEQQLRKGEDKIAIEKAQNQTGLTYIQSKVIKKGGKPFMQVYLISNEEYYKSNEFADGGSFAPNVADGTQFMNNVYAKGGSTDSLSVNKASILSATKKCTDGDSNYSTCQSGNFEVTMTYAFHSLFLDFVYLDYNNPRFNPSKEHYASYAYTKGSKGILTDFDQTVYTKQGRRTDAKTIISKTIEVIKSLGYPVDSIVDTDGEKIEDIKYADGGMFDDNEGFMRADNERSFRYPEREVRVDSLDESVDLTSNVSYQPNEVVIRTLDENIDLNDDNRIRARMGSNPMNRNPNKMMAVNPRMIVADLPKPTSSTHKND